MNPLDLHAASDVSDAEEAAYEKCVDRIARMDGRALFESGNFQMDDTDGMFDMYDLPRVFTAPKSLPWAEMSRSQQCYWNNLARAIATFAYDRLDPDKAMAHADQI